MNASVKVKISHKSDIRRFTIQSNISYSELHRVISRIYPKLPWGWVMKYYDDEGDLISITNQQEITEAMEISKDNDLLRLVIDSFAQPKCTDYSTFVISGSEDMQEIGSPISDTQEIAPSDYFEVTEKSQKVPELRVDHEAYCNNCGNDIYDIRFKCGNCDDYDLCSDCELLWSSNLNIHNTKHVFLKIYSPLPDAHTSSRLLNSLYDDNDDESSSDSESDSEEESEKDSGDLDEDSQRQLEIALSDLTDAQNELSRIADNIQEEPSEGEPRGASIEELIADASNDNENDTEDNSSSSDSDDDSDSDNSSSSSSSESESESDSEEEETEEESSSSSSDSDCAYQDEDGKTEKESKAAVESESESESDSESENEVEEGDNNNNNNDSTIVTETCVTEVVDDINAGVGEVPNQIVPASPAPEEDLKKAGLMNLLLKNIQKFVLGERVVANEEVTGEEVDSAVVLEMIQDMGFPDAERNLDLFRENKGDVHALLDQLLQV